MDLEALARSHAFMKVERPPELWSSEEEHGPAADAAGAVYAYVRDLDGEGSVTALLPRLTPRPEGSV